MNSSKDIYKEDINFAQLASQDPEFAKVLKPNGQVDFSDPDSVQQLTKSLLKRDFGLRIVLPPDRLCPPVPNRLNYLLWIQDLLDTTSSSYSDRHDPKREVIGLDIGTGASCIYPLLGCAQYPSWKFAATDIDDHSLKFARENITLNNLSSRIRLLKSDAEGPLLPLDALGLDTLHFCMCNPPFYTSSSDLLSSASAKSRPPNSACTGSASEMVTPGGEIAFVSQILAESMRLRERVQWYTSMLGKLSSVPVLVDKLRQAGCTNWAVAELVQGTKTRRWVLGWSWGDLRPSVAVSRGVGSLERRFLPFPSEFVVQVPGTGDERILEVGERVNAALSALPLQWRWRPEICTGVGFAARNVWSRAARRHSKATNGEEEDEEEEDDMAFGFKISVRSPPATENVFLVTEVTVRWLKGRDTVVFESFCGMVKRKVEAP